MVSTPGGTGIADYSVLRASHGISLGSVKRLWARPDRMGTGIEMEGRAPRMARRAGGWRADRVHAPV